MKAVASFMAMLVLVLSLLPCSDGDDHSHACASTECTAYSIAQSTHSEHGDQYEHCSPFCHCNCCHSVVTVAVPMIAPQPSGLLGQRLPILHTETLPSAHTELWRPPIA